MDTIVLRTTNECNLRCKYCYDANNHDVTTSKKLATENFYKNRKEILNDVKTILLNSRRPSIIFHGGEPLLVDVELLNDFCEELNKSMNIRYSIQTNGTLINNNTIDFFKNNKMNVGISLDGATPEQNASRIYKNGNGTFNTVMKKIHLLKKYGVKFGVVMSISKLHIGKEQELYDFLAENNINCNIRPVFPSMYGNNENVMTSSEYINFFNDLFDIWFNDNEKRVSTGQISELHKELSKVLLPGYRDRSCECSNNCFSNFISLDTNGNLYSCNRLYNINDFYYGNIRTTDLEIINEKVEHLLDERKKSIQNICKNCESINMCNGGCPAEAYSFYGTINMPSAYCEIRKGINEHIKKKVFVLSLYRIIRMYLRLSGDTST